ncbi:polysaccharide export outer membrane protein [Pseudochelatococcus lubricantis]|uniref:Polysaccharide export outer membrane protein n=1 Tax=Pseudochelatococcus lubricantis TaxID=1538102 RepID=A0ABX0V098_9HYPH|nr:polysaccharide biosynthesis/export family protein [Pseudochelatococcus lubricantis]NIJ58048.1 polysaccharide export outer membrane protein [Pseudochelatococcus lubricantis]
MRCMLIIRTCAVRIIIGGILPVLYRGTVATVLFISVLSLPPARARAEYLLDAGDVVEIVLYGVADFNRRAAVNIDGNVAVPFLGEVRAAGLSIAGLREEIARRLEAEGYFRGPHVTVELTELRPFYISGDITRPGAHPFRPGLTVRHAIALAGGYNVLRFQAENPLLATPEIQGRYDSLWVDLVTRQARVLALQAAMEGRTDIDFSVLNSAPLPKATIDKLTQLERTGTNLRLETHRRQLDYLRRVVAQAEQEIKPLEELVTRQDESLAMQIGATERAAANSARGVTTNNRLDEERRALAFLRGQQIDARARLSAARRQLEEQRLALGRIESERQQGLAGELIGALAELERARSQVRATAEQLLYAGAMRSQMYARDGTGPNLTIVRRNGSAEEHLQVSEDTPMQPGDVLEVSARLNRVVVAPQD